MKRDEEKKFETIRHKYEQSVQEKESFKRQLDNYKQKAKREEIQDIKLQKALNLQDDQQFIQKSPKQ